MVEPGFIYASMSIQRGGSPTAWETCEVLLDQCDVRSNVIAVTQAGSYLDKMLRTVLPPERLFIHPTKASLGTGPFSRTVSLHNGVNPPTILGQNDHDIVPTRRPWPHVDSDGLVRMRTMDGLYSRSHKPALIVIEADMADVLAGAVDIIRKHRPAILLNLLAVPSAERLTEWEHCVSLIASYRYSWCDGFFLPCDSAERRYELVDPLCGGVACARPADIMPASAPKGPGVTAGAASLAERDWVSEIRFDRNRTGKIQIVFDGSALAKGLHSPETDGAGSSWCWSGPSNRVRVAVPLPASGSWFLRVEVFDWGIAHGGHDLRAYVGANELKLNTSGHNFVRFGPILQASREASGCLMIEIDTPRPCRASDNDSRSIAVGLSRCVLERAT